LTKETQKGKGEAPLPIKKDLNQLGMEAKTKSTCTRMTCLDPGAVYSTNLQANECHMHMLKNKILLGP